MCGAFLRSTCCNSHAGARHRDGLAQRRLQRSQVFRSGDDFGRCRTTAHPSKHIRKSRWINRRNRCVARFCDRHVATRTQAHGIDTDARSGVAGAPGSSGQVTSSAGLESQPTPQSTYENPDGFDCKTDVWLVFAIDILQLARRRRTASTPTRAAASLALPGLPVR